MIRSAILAAARNDRLADLVTRAPVSRSVVRRFVGGPDTATAVDVARELLAGGLSVSLDHLGEDTTDRTQAAATVTAYLDLLQALDDHGLTGRRGPLDSRAEISVKLSAVGQALGADGERIALDHARTLAARAREVGATVTLDMEDHTTTDSTLEVLHRVRVDFPETGAVLQSYLRRTESDCRDLAYAGSRVRLCKGAYDEPSAVAFTDKLDVDLSYVRCAKVLLAGGGYPMFATHDPRLIEILQARTGDPSGFEFQLLYGIRPDEQARLAAAGHTVRVYVPYGAQWYGYLMRRLAERPANLAFFARALVGKS